MIIEANPEAKIFGMSATSVRSFGTKYEEDVAESFFEGNVASRYDLAQAIVDGVLPHLIIMLHWLYLKVIAKN